MSDSDDQGDSILDNLNKTRELWSSKADLGTANYLIPKSPTSHSASKRIPQTSSNSLPNGNTDAPVEVVRADDQVVEEYELPDIKSMRSQWEVPNNNNTAYVPLPSNKSPAVIAREKTVREKTKDKPPPELVNREEEQSDETYEVELTKLKAQFESAARAAGKTRPKSPKSMPKAVIKDQVNRFEDEMTSTGEKIQTEQRTETEQISVDLTGIKSQFESRKDEHLVTPELTAKRLQEKSGSNRSVKAKAQPSPSSPSKEMSPGSDGDDSGVSPRIEPVKSSEPVYDEMVGEESVKDRLQRYQSITERTRERQASVERKFAKRTIVRRSSVSSSEEEQSQSVEEIVKSPPAGTREQPDYTPSVDLRQTKALFETPESKKRSVVPRRHSSARSSSESNSHSPARSTRSSSRNSRNSSRHNTPSPNRRPKSPANTSSTRSCPVSPTSSDMSDVVKPPPAGTKETADFVPSVKISSLKSMFEKSKSSTSPTSAQPPKRRQLRGEDWANGNEDEAKKDGAEGKVVSEGFYENRQGVVRPPTAGTKERPSYSLSSDFLKSRAALFDSPQQNSYTPRNKVSVKNVNTPTEVVNAQSGPSELDYELSSSLKDTKKMFENGQAASPEKPTPTQRKTQLVKTQTGEVVRPPPAGTRDESDVIPASNLNSAKSVFENQQEAPVPAARKEPIDIRQEAAEAQEREQEATEQTVEPEEEASESEGEYTFDNENALNEDEGAAVTPVRVAVPEPEQPGDDESEKDFIKEEKDYPSEDVDQYDNDVPGLVEQGHEVQNDEEPPVEEEEEEADVQTPEEVDEDQAPEADAPAEQEVEDQTAEDNALAPEEEVEEQQDADTGDVDDSQEPEDRGMPEETGAPADEELEETNGDNEPATAQVDVEDNQEYEEEPSQQGEGGEDAIVLKQQQQSEEATENGLGADQQTGMSLLDDSSHSDDSDDYDKPHFHYIHNETVEEPKKSLEAGDVMLLDTSTFESSSNVDLLNSFSGPDVPAPSGNLGAEYPQSADPFDIFAPAPSKAPPGSDPFDPFSSTQPPPSNGEPAKKDPFDLFL